MLSSSFSFFSAERPAASASAAAAAFSSTASFRDRLNSLHEQIAPLVDQWERQFVPFHKNPEVDTYSTAFSNTQNQIRSLSQNLVQTTQDIQSKIKEVDAVSGQLSAQIQKDKDRANRLRARVDASRNTTLGSETLIDDAKTMYNTQYYKNVEMLVGIVLLVVMLRRV